jgi:(2Fe-2S) ferredoxin
MSDQSTNPDPNESARQLRRIAASTGIGTGQRHIIFCSSENCCGEGPEGQAAWDMLKQRLKELGLSEQTGRVLRTRALCLRLCQQGPIAVVYPEGTWYSRLSGERLERVIREHLMEGRPVLEYAFMTAPLPAE